VGNWDGDTLVVDLDKVIAGKDKEYNKLIFKMMKKEIYQLKNAIYRVYKDTEDKDTKKYADKVLYMFDGDWRKVKNEQKTTAA
jgi:hypothetical protein